MPDQTLCFGVLPWTFRHHSACRSSHSLITYGQGHVLLPAAIWDFEVDIRHWVPLLRFEYQIWPGIPVHFVLAGLVIPMHPHHHTTEYGRGETYHVVISLCGDACFARLDILFSLFLLIIHAIMLFLHDCLVLCLCYSINRVYFRYSI